MANPLKTLGKLKIYTSSKNASVAQLVEQWTENPRVVGSIPTGGTNSLITSAIRFAELAHLVERHLAKVEVASSSLVFRSKFGAIAKW